MRTRLISYRSGRFVPRVDYSYPELRRTRPRLAHRQPELSGLPVDLATPDRRTAGAGGERQDAR